MILSVLLYGFSAFNQISFDTIYPLTLMNDHRFGGFEMNAVEESWIATFCVLTQLGTCLLWCVRLTRSVDLSFVEPNHLVPNPALLDHDHLRRGDLLRACSVSLQCVQFCGRGMRAVRS